MMRVLVVGSVALDTVRTPFGEAEDAMGGSAVYFAAAASYFSEVDVVGVVGEDFPRQDLAFLETRNVSLEGLEVQPGQTFRWSGEYERDVNVRRTLDTQLNVFASFRPRIPEAYRDCPYVFLANIDPELQLSVLEQVHTPKVVACDTMNFWIEGNRDALLNLLSQVHILILNDEEARLLTGEVHLLRAIRAIFPLGPKVVIVKKGEHGALMSTHEALFFAPAFPTECVLDPTGAGDCFAGGFMGYLAQSDEMTDTSLRQAVICGSVMASFNVEQFSVEGLKSIPQKEISARFDRFRAITAFEPLSGTD